MYATRSRQQIDYFESSDEEDIRSTTDDDNFDFGDGLSSADVEPLFNIEISSRQQTQPRFRSAASSIQAFTKVEVEDLAAGAGFVSIPRPPIHLLVPGHTELLNPQNVYHSILSQSIATIFE